MLVSLLIQFCVVGTVIVVIDNTVGSLLETVKSRRLSSAASDDLVALEHRIATLKKDIQATTTRLEKDQALQRPDLQSVKNLAGQYRLQVRRVERVTNTAKAVGIRPTYNVTCTGPVLDVIPFLHQLEREFILESDQVTLQRNDENGETAALTLVMQVERE